MKHSEDYENATSIITSLCALDRGYLEWTHNLPPECVFTQAPIGDGQQSKEAYDNHYLVYSSIWIASIWNNYRCARILANELLRDQVSHLLQSSDALDDQEQSSYETMLDTAINTMKTLCNEIFDSVPSFLSTRTNEPPRALAGNLLLWPLYLASQTSVATDEMRRWAAERLGYIADTIGIRQAVPMVMSLRKTLDIEVLVDSVAEMSMKEAL